jgi:hypothetical protein
MRMRKTDSSKTLRGEKKETKMKWRKWQSISLLFGVLWFVVMFCGACSEAATLPTVENIVLGILPIVAAFGASVLPEESTAINTAVSTATGAIKVLQSVVAAYNATPTTGTLSKVTAGFDAVQADLTQLMAAAQVKNPAAQAKVTNVVNAAVLALGGVEAVIQAESASKITSAA